ncbi:MAG: DUF2281 domain-containing protein [Treponema sp.]|nr:DUF2281 domain-containing protein [Treponema sp.]
MPYTELLLEEIRTLPYDRVAEVLNFVEFLKHKDDGKTEYTIL